QRIPNSVSSHRELGILQTRVKSKLEWIACADAVGDTTSETLQMSVHNRTLFLFLVQNIVSSHEFSPP
ncbi:unnamed protein product, partial [Nesidiocoris tenuis]